MNIDLTILKSFMIFLIEETITVLVRFGLLLFFLILFYYRYFKKERPVFLWNFFLQIKHKILARKFNAALKAGNIGVTKKLLVENALINVKSSDCDRKILALQQLAQFDTEDAFKGLYDILLTESDYDSRKLIIRTLAMIIKKIENRRYE